MMFKDPWILLLLPLVIILTLLLRKRDLNSTIRFSSGELVKGFRPTLKLRLARRMIYLRALAVMLILLALARPRLPLEETKIETEGIDIVLAIDTSTSMLAEDFQVGRLRKNRLVAAKQVVEEFIQMRQSDRIAMVAFAARAYTVCPLTLDYSWLIKNLERVEIGAIEDGTAIGSAISTSLNRLKDTQAKSKIIVLLTDGINNAGKISPLTAAEAAQALQVKIYTIGAGTKGLAPFPARNVFGQTVYQNIKLEIDEAMLQQVAELTGGKYYRATDTYQLRKIYGEIDALEKTMVEEKGFQQYQELFFRLLIPGFLLLILEVVLSNSILRKLP